MRLYLIYDCFFLDKVTSKISKPFAINDNTFQNYNATLYVPKGTVDKYKATDGWKKFFKNIVEEGTTTAIDDVEADNTLNTSNAIFDINGKRLPATSLDELPSGLYIINGKKVVKCPLLPPLRPLPPPSRGREPEGDGEKK